MLSTVLRRTLARLHLSPPPPSPPSALPPFHSATRIASASRPIVSTVLFHFHRFGHRLVNFSDRGRSVTNRVFRSRRKEHGPGNEDRDVGAGKGKKIVGIGTDDGVSGSGGSDRGGGGGGG